MWSVTVDLWIGNAAAVWSHCWGAISRRAHETGLSRTTIYKHAQRVEQAVFNEQLGGVRYEVLWSENERLRAENEALWQAWAEAEQISYEELIDCRRRKTHACCSHLLRGFEFYPYHRFDQAALSGFRLDRFKRNVVA